MNKTKLSVITAVAITICVTVIFLGPTKNLIEQQRIDAANEIYFAEIFSRCSEIDPLVQFIDIFEPAEALEFFDNATMKEVVSIAAVVEIDGKYEASFVAPVVVSENGKYELTDHPTITIVDLKGGKFTKTSPSATVSGPSIRLGPVLWKRFIDSGANIDSLRKVELYSNDA